MKVGIVGSRRRNSVRDRNQVLNLIVPLKHRYADLELVSGGCPQGADRFAEEMAAICKIPIKVFPIDRSAPIENRGEFAKRAYARNRQIAEYADVIYAFCARDRKGGTENTISHAHELGKTVYVVDEDGQIYLDREERTDEA